MGLYLKLFGNPKCYRWNLFLLQLAYKGLGIDQWKNVQISGEKYFLEHILPRNCQTIFDVGAYRGSYSREVMNFHPRSKLYAFEPHPKSFKHLQQVALNLNFKAYQHGLGSERTLKKLYDYLDREGSSQASVYKEMFRTSHMPITQHDIALTTLDDFCKDNAIEHIDLLKIETEGFEYEVLMGSSRMIGSLSVDIIQFELNQLSLSSKKTIFDFMELLPEYRFYRMLHRGMIPLHKHKMRMHASTEHQNIIAWSNGARHAYDEKRNKTIIAKYR